MRALAFVLIVLLCGPALAQPQQPQPRTALDVELPAAPDYRLYGRGGPGRLAVGADGTHYLLTNSFRPSNDTAQPALDARIELWAFARDGTPKFRTQLPIEHRLGPLGFEIESLGVAVLPSGEVAVFLGSRNEAIGQSVLGTPLTLYFGVSATGAVLRVVPVAPPSGGDQSGNTYSTHFYVPTADNGLLVGGGFGGGPFSWWIGKFGPDGQRGWQAGSGTGFPEDVYALAVRPDGTIEAVVLVAGSVQGFGGWYLGSPNLARFAADGTVLSRARLEQEGDIFVALADSYLAVLSAYDTSRRPELVHLDQTGKVSGRVPWSYEKTWFAMPHGDGIAAIACYRFDGPPCYVVSAGLDGKVRWQSPPVTTSDIARTPDGQIAALIWSDNGMRARLVRYADPL